MAPGRCSVSSASTCCWFIWHSGSTTAPPRAYEQVTVTASELTVRKVTPLGRVREWTLNPLWVRLQQDVHEEFGMERLFLISRGQRMAIAGFLGPEEKASFAKALSQALFEAKRGPAQKLAGAEIGWFAASGGLSYRLMLQSMHP